MNPIQRVKIGDTVLNLANITDVQYQTGQVRIGLTGGGSVHLSGKEAEALWAFCTASIHGCLDLRCRNDDSSSVEVSGLKEAV